MLCEDCEYQCYGCDRKSCEACVKCLRCDVCKERVCFQCRDEDNLCKDCADEVSE